MLDTRVVRPFWKAPRNMQNWWTTIAPTEFKEHHDPSTESDHEVAVNEIHKTWKQRRFDIDRPIFVTVQKTLTHLEEGPTVCTAIPFPERHLIVVNEWALERIGGRDRYDVLAHELCHLQHAEKYGRHDETDREFGRLVSQKRAASSTEDVTSEDFWEKHPTSA